VSYINTPDQLARSNSKSQFRKSRSGSNRSHVMVWIADRCEYVRRAGGLVRILRRAPSRFVYDLAGRKIRVGQRALARW